MISPFGNCSSTCVSIFLACALGGILHSEDPKKDETWPVIEIDGVNHVSAEAIKGFYQVSLTKGHKNGALILRHPAAVMKLDQPNQLIQINKTRIASSIPLRLGDDEQILVSTIDLT